MELTATTDKIKTIILAKHSQNMAHTTRARFLNYMDHIETSSLVQPHIQIILKYL